MWLYLDSCLVSDGNNYMCSKALFQAFDGLFFLWPSVLAAIGAALNFIIFFISLALAFSTGNTVSNTSTFANKATLYAAGMVFSLSFPMIKFRVFNEQLCNGDKGQMEFWSGSFIGFTVTGMIVGWVDDALMAVAEKIPRDAKLGVKVVWAFMCLVGVIVVLVVHPNHRGMLGYMAGIICSGIVFVWSLVDLGILVHKKINNIIDVPSATFVVKSNDPGKSKKDDGKEGFSEDGSMQPLLKHANMQANQLFYSDDVRLSLRLRNENSQQSFLLEQD